MLSLKSEQFRVLILISVAFFATAVTDPVRADDHLTITTWNIENLGGDSRGFASGIGSGMLGECSDAQLEAVAVFIRDVVKSDVVAIQEVSITSIDEDGNSYCEPLDTIVEELGEAWDYYLPEVQTIPQGHDNLFCALLWNGERVRRLKAFAAQMPNPELVGAHLFDRAPVVGYFEARKNGGGTNDFVIVNVHLKSNQNNDENHLIAMTVLEHGLTRLFKQKHITESDRIIVGDFNDNPYAKRDSGRQRYSDALYHHMAFKGYVNLVTADIGYTRMNDTLTSLIDHILVNKSAKGHIPDDKATIWRPTQTSEYAAWRATYSDHFPVSFRLRIEDEEHDADY